MTTQTTDPSPYVFTVTPSDSVNFTQEVRQLYCGTSGNVAIVNLDDSVATFVGVNAGTTIGPFYIKRINSTGTTCTGLLAFI